MQDCVIDVPLCEHIDNLTAEITSSHLDFLTVTDRLPIAIDYLIVGIWALFSIMFVSLIYKWFFGRL